MKTEVEVLVALGANEGSRRQTCAAAIGRLSTLPKTQLVAVSSFVETRSVRWCETSKWPTESAEYTQKFAESTEETTAERTYLNAVGRWRTTLTLETFFAMLQTIETELGRVRPYRWAPRRMDLDLLFYGDHIQRTSLLWLPHPRLHLRRFVLEPAMEIAGEWRHPVLGETITALAKRLDSDAPLAVRNLPTSERTRFWKKIESLWTSSMGGLSGPDGRTTLQWNHSPGPTAGPVVDAKAFPTVMTEGDAIWSDTALDALAAETFAALQSRRHGECASASPMKIAFE